MEIVAVIILVIAAVTGGKEEPTAVAAVEVAKEEVKEVAVHDKPTYQKGVVYWSKEDGYYIGDLSKPDTEVKEKTMCDAQVSTQLEETDKATQVASVEFRNCEG